MQRINNIKYLLNYSISIYTLLLLSLLSCSTNSDILSDSESHVKEANEGVLYETIFSPPFIISKPQDEFVINNLYSLAERKIEYVCSFSRNTKAKFLTTKRGVSCIVDTANKTLEIDGVVYSAENLECECDISITFEKSYQTQVVKVDSGDIITEIKLNNDGEGGVGKGAVNSSPLLYPMPHGCYKMELLSGGLSLKKVRITTPSKQIYLIIYGDSITETESYYPNQLFPFSWPQLLIESIPGSITSAISGCKVSDIMKRIESELPYLDVKYVMITIGTNGGNTIESLSSMIEYILSLGITPILNHIPCNESSTQVEVNMIIDEVRKKYGLSGADFDIVTSINGDGVELDKSTMFWEDYGPDYKRYNHDYWHHPNEKGSRKMFERIKTDLPWLFF